MGIKRYNLLLISFLLITSTLYLSYFVLNLSYIKYVEILIYVVLILLYNKMPKQNIRRGNSEQLYIVMVVFAIVYLLRAFLDLNFREARQELYTNDITVYFYIFNGMLVPLYFLPRVKFVGNFKWAYYFTAIILLFAMAYSIDKFLHSDVRSSYRNQMFGVNDNISVIEYGYLGLTTSIMGVVLLMKRNEHKLFLWSSVPLIIIGIVSIFLSGTRGAMFGLFAIFAIYAFATMKKKTIIPFILFFFFLVFFSESIIRYSESYNVDSPVIRIFRLVNEGGDQSSGRTNIWAIALGQIMESPFYGVSCFFKSPYEEVHYVHNSFLEVFYALGIFGFMAFVVVNFVAIKTCIKIFKSDNTDKICFAFLYLQYFVSSLFSNSIIRLPLYWYFLAVILSIYFDTNSIPLHNKVKQ